MFEAVERREGDRPCPKHIARKSASKHINGYRSEHVLDIQNKICQNFAGGGLHFLVIVGLLPVVGRRGAWMVVRYAAFVQPSF